MSKYARAIPPEAYNRKVFVYFNLHSGLWSVKDVKTGRVLGHSDRVALQGAAYKVSQAGRQRVLREGKKNVHAGVVGYLVAFGEGAAQYMDNKQNTLIKLYGYVDAVSSFQKVTYNPYKFSSFVKMEDNEFQVVHSAYAFLGHNRAVWAQAVSGIKYE